MTTKPKLEQIRTCLIRVGNPFRTKKKNQYGVFHNHRSLKQEIYLG